MVSTGRSYPDRRASLCLWRYSNPKCTQS